MGDDGDNSILLRLSFVKLFPKLRPQDFQYSRKIHEPIISRFQSFGSKEIRPPSRRGRREDFTLNINMLLRPTAFAALLLATSVDAFSGRHQRCPLRMSV